MNRFNLDVIFYLSAPSNKVAADVTVVDYETLEKQLTEMTSFPEAVAVICKIASKK